MQRASTDDTNDNDNTLTEQNPTQNPTPKRELNAIGIQLKHLLRNDTNNCRIKHAVDIEDYMKNVSRSLYPTNEKTIKQIYKHSEKHDERLITDLGVNYTLTEEYLQAFKKKMMDECDKLIHEVKVKKNKLKIMETAKINSTITLINNDERDKKIETECLKKISTLPDEIIRLISSFVLTNEVRLILIKTKYDNTLNNIMMKMNRGTLIRCIQQYVKNNNKLFKSIDCNGSKDGTLDNILKEYHFSRYRGDLDYSRRKTEQITKFITELEEMDKFIKLLQNIMDNRYKSNNETIDYLKQRLIRNYHTCIYISNKSIENAKNKRITRKETMQINQTTN
jgi:hypothetical protein